MLDVIEKINKMYNWYIYCMGIDKTNSNYNTVMTELCSKFFEVVNGPVDTNELSNDLKAKLLAIYGLLLNAGYIRNKEVKVSSHK